MCIINHSLSLKIQAMITLQFNFGSCKSQWLLLLRVPMAATSGMGCDDHLQTAKSLALPLQLEHECQERSTCLLGLWRCLLLELLWRCSLIEDEREEFCDNFSCLDFSLTTWQSNPMCFVGSWYTRFAAIWRATWVSHNNVTGSNYICRSWNRNLGPISSHVAVAIDLYSALPGDLKNIFCFFVFQKIKESSRNAQ